MRPSIYLLPMLLAACGTAPEAHLDPMIPAATTTDSAAAQADVKITPIYHAALALERNGVTVYVDPYNGADRFKGLPAPQVVLITDIHPDHLDTATLRGLDLSKARIVAPKAVMDLLPADLRAIGITLANGEHTSVAGASIDALPMYNMPDPNDPRHPKGRGNGYVVGLGGQRIYISGDTEDIPEMRALTGIDVAFVCMNLPYTMPVDRAADGVLAFKPRVVYPYHYRNQDGSLSDVAHFKDLVNKGDPAIEVRLADWYPK